MTQKRLFNRGWKYTDSFNDSYINPSYNEEGFEKVTIPHTNRQLPYNCFDERDYQFISCYRKTFEMGREDQNKRIFLDFDGVMTAAKVYLNGELVCEHKGGYTPFCAELTAHLFFDRENTVTVMVDSKERSDIPPFGGVVDYLCFGGIYRDVFIRICDRVFIENVLISTPAPLQPTKAIEAKLQFSQRVSGTITLTLQDNGTILGSGTYTVEHVKNTTVLLKDLEGLELWDTEQPKLYDVVVTLDAEDVLDTYTTRIGFRDAQLTASGFFLNGKRIKLAGLNRHQSFPYVGYAMPKRVQQKDADILKYELGLNCVRTSHYPQSPHFLDRCDEIGLLVFEEIPGWQHIGDESWKELSYRDTKAMIERDFNHPSIFLWGVRINESQDDSQFYLKTNAIAHHHDTTRQTGGVRCITGSEMLEDVYTMNDFIYDAENRFLRPQQEVTGLDYDVPYLVTEYGGHMFPTKRFDQEERLSENALRHLHIQNAAFGDDSISGAIGWCAFDYNTHYEFGSGDRICYHGVSDMFRIPKFAAFAYTSQMSPQRKLVLEPLTLWTIGERNRGGVEGLTVCTNCDYVKLYIGGEFYGTFYPDKERFEHLPHPPIRIEGLSDMWGKKWRDAKFVGCIGDQEVIEKEFAAAPVPTALVAEPDDTVLEADGMDMTRVVYKLVDQMGNLMPFANEVIRFKVKGGKIVGPERTALIGGCIAVWIKAPSKAGEIILKASCSRFKAEKVVIQAK